MFVIISVATDIRAVGMMAGVAVGSVVMMNAFVGGPITGASMNPARSIAPAFFSGEWSYMLIYILAPCVGAVMAVKFYEWIRYDSADSKQSKKNVKVCC